MAKSELEKGQRSKVELFPVRAKQTEIMKRKLLFN